MGDTKKTIQDFGGDFDAYTKYRVGLLVESVNEVARRNGVTPQQAFDGMVRASVLHAKRLRRDRLAKRN